MSQSLDPQTLKYQAVTHMTNGMKSFVAATNVKEQEQAMLAYANGLTCLQKLIEVETNPEASQALKSKFDYAVDEYTKMREKVEAGIFYQQKSQQPTQQQMQFQQQQQQMQQQQFLQQQQLLQAQEKNNLLLREVQGLVEAAQKMYKEGNDSQKADALALYEKAFALFDTWGKNELNDQSRIYWQTQIKSVIQEYEGYKDAIKKAAEKKKDKELKKEIAQDVPTRSDDFGGFVENAGFKGMIALDNSKIRAEVTYKLSQGKKMFNEGETQAEKEEGLKLAMKGLQLFEVWIKREYDPTFVKTLQESYQTNKEEIQRMKDIWEGKSTDVKSTDGQMVKKRNDGKGGSSGEDKEKDKMREALGEAIVSEKPNVKWDDIAGLINAKKALQEAVILPIRYPQLFVGAVKPWKGILLYGPPGTGKTYLAKACATETEGTFFSISSSDLISKYVGESEKMIKQLFGMAREKKPAVIFIDEIDSICGARSDNENEATRRVKTEFLVQMQGVGNNSDGVLVLGATNLPWALDTAIRRRFERRIYIPLPDIEARLFLIEHNLKKNDVDITSEQVTELAELTEGYSGSDMANLVKDAVYGPVRKCQTCQYWATVTEGGVTKYTPVPDNELKKWSGYEIKKMNLVDITGDQLKVPRVTADDFKDALKKTRSSVSKDQLVDYEKWTQEFGQDG